MYMMHNAMTKIESKTDSNETVYLVLRYQIGTNPDPTCHIGPSPVHVKYIHLLSLAQASRSPSVYGLKSNCGLRLCLENLASCQEEHTLAEVETSASCDIISSC